MKKEYIFLLLILCLGLFFRLYKIDAYMTYLGDEGRDDLIVRRIFTQSHPPLIGPGTSVGSMYLGPLYYYMMAPALLLANFSPVGPAIMVALVNCLTLFLIWYITRKWFGTISAFVAAGLYSISPTAIIFAKSSWNPNIMPFFALLVIIALWQVWQEKKYLWLVVLGVATAFVLQSHYLGLILLPVILTFWFFSLITELGGGLTRFVRYSLAGFVTFLVLMSPLLIFDIRHNWLNTRAILTFINNSQGAVSLDLPSVVKSIPGIATNLMTRLPAGRDITLGLILTLVAAAAIFYLLVIKKERFEQIKHSAYALLFCWLGFGIIGLAFYRGAIYDHYMGFLFPAPFILLGALVSELSSSFRLRMLYAMLYVVLVVVSIFNSPLKNPPQNQLNRARVVSQKIIQETNGKPFNLAVLSETNYEDGYQYLLELFGAKVVDADSQHKESITETLMVVCEKEPPKCDPTHSSKAEVANFGWSKIDKEWQIEGVMVYKLVHTK